MDPGYNTETAKKESFSKFLSQNAPKGTAGEAKRSMVGPGQVKSRPPPPKEQDLLDVKYPPAQNQDLI